MNSLVEFANALGDRLIIFAGPLLWQSSLLIAVLFVLDLAMRRRVRAVVRYALWMLLPIKLLLPASLALPTGLGSWIRLPESTSAMSSPVLLSPAVFLVKELPSAMPSVVQGPVAASQVAKISPQPQPRAIGSRMSVSGVVAVGWLTGVMVLNGSVWVRRRRILRLVAEARPAPTAIHGLVQTCRERLSLRCRVEVRVTDAVPAPAICGLFRPTILLPGHLLTGLSESQVEAVLLHELAHVKRFDLWVNHLQTILQILHFYHPLLWPANAAIRRVREEAVDEVVLATLAQGAAAYPETLLTVAQLTSPQPRLIWGLVGIFEGPSQLGRRVRLMLARPFPRNARIGLGGVIVLVGLGAILLPMSRAAAPPPQNGAVRLTSESTEPNSIARKNAIEAMETQVTMLDAQIQKSLAALNEVARANGVGEQTASGVGNILSTQKNRIVENQIDAELILYKHRILYEKLTNIESNRLPFVLQQVYPDPGLSTLLESLANAQLMVARIGSDVSDTHPDLMRAKVILAMAESQVNNKVKGMMQGLATQVEVDRLVYASTTERVERAVTEDLDLARRLRVFNEAKREVEELQRLRSALNLRLAAERVELNTAVQTVDASGNAQEAPVGEVWILGEVRSPGRVKIPSDAPLTLSKAIIAAGGFGQFANKKKIEVTRGSPPVKTVIDLTDAWYKGKADHDFILKPGDRVMVTSKTFYF